MSVYYEFYAAKKIEEDGIEKIKLVSSIFDAETKKHNIEPLLWRSGGFIDGIGIRDCMSQLPITMIAKEDLDILTIDYSGDNPYSLALYIPYSEAVMKADAGLVKGYATLEEIHMLSQNDIWYDNIVVLSSDMVAEMQPDERKKYGHIAFIDKQSVGYIFNVIAENISSHSLFDDKYYIVCRIC
jgi:hypothetical protein